MNQNLADTPNHTLALAYAINSGLWDIDTAWHDYDDNRRSHIVMLWPQWDAPTITAVWRYHDDQLEGFTGDYAYTADNETTELDNDSELVALIRQTIENTHA